MASEPARGDTQITEQVVEPRQSALIADRLARGKRDTGTQARLALSLLAREAAAHRRLGFHLEVKLQFVVGLRSCRRLRKVAQNAAATESDISLPRLIAGLRSLIRFQMRALTRHPRLTRLA